MRSTLAAVMGAFVLTVSLIVVWASGVESASPWAMAVQSDRAGAPSEAFAASDKDCDTDYSGSLPAYYRCKRVDGEWQYRYWNGTEWLGPLVEEGIDDLYSKVIAEVGPEVFEAVWYLLGGDADALQVAFILFAWYLANSEAAQPQAVVPPSSSPSPSPSPSLPPSPVQSPATEAAMSLSPNHRFVWNWGSTMGRFDGTVTGNAGRWTYTGTSISSWPPGLHAGGGTATCTFEGDPEIEMPESGWPMDCDLYWQGDATWTGVIAGRFYPIHDETGALVDFEFQGSGHGTDGGDWSPIEVLLTPCEPGAVC